MEFTSRRLLQIFLSPLGEIHVAVNGKEAVDAVRLALEEGVPYALICLDIRIPELDGQEVLRSIRDMEAQKGIAAGAGAKILMTTVLSDNENIQQAFQQGCDDYLVKPIEKNVLFDKLRSLGIST